METPFSKLKKKFDKIYLLTLSSRLDRSRSALNMLKNIGLEDENDLTVIYATPFPHNDIIADAFNRTNRGRFTKPNEYDCSRNHYSIIKQAYDLGYESILVLEDDIQFIKDFDKFNEYVDAITEDYDILQFGGFSADPKILEYMKSESKWVQHQSVGLWTTSMYALSHRGMQYYLAFMEKFFWVADGPLYKAPLNSKIVKTYMSNIPLAIQADKDIVSSDIRDENNDKIDYNNQNMYEHNISRENYFDYK